jgi:hypothetical protein
MNKSKKVFLCLVIGMIFLLPTNVNADLTKEQSEKVALFATTLIEKGNQRRDENGYPLMVYALSNNSKTCIEIRRSGYQEELYHVKNNFAILYYLKWYKCITFFTKSYKLVQKFNAWSFSKLSNN